MSHLSNEQLSRLIDGELSLGARDTAQRHLRDCAHCQEQLDAFVDIAAELRLTPAVTWDAGATARLLTQLDHRRPREWSTPIAVAIAVLGALLLALELPAISSLTGMLTSITSVLTAFLPTGVGLPSAPALAILLVVAILGPLLAMPLSRRR